jgi:hypothetical protein
MRKTKPVIDHLGTKQWFRDGELHRVNGPAIEYANGDRVWFFKGHLHRTNGPAVEYINGDKYWYLNGVEYPEDQFRLLAFVNSQLTA